MEAGHGGGGKWRNRGSTGEEEEMMLGFHVVGPNGLLLGFYWIIVRLVSIYRKIYRIPERGGEGWGRSYQ
jgi:hypothetical protein